MNDNKELSKTENIDYYIVQHKNGTKVYAYKKDGDKNLYRTATYGCYEGGKTSFRDQIIIDPSEVISMTKISQ